MVHIQVTVVYESYMELPPESECFAFPPEGLDLIDGVNLILQQTSQVLRHSIEE